MKILADGEGGADTPPRESCPSCGSPDPAWRRIVDTGKPRKPICQDAWHGAGTPATADSSPDVDWSDENEEPDEDEPYYDPDEDPEADVTAQEPRAAATSDIKALSGS